MTPAPHTQNPKWFLLFRILFNCRFYYPVYTIFFLDAGLTMDQFATLNFLWAIAIVVLEVPSGALADYLGRRKLLVAAAVFMVLEMACLVFLPLRAGGLTFWIFAINRVLSGAAEACASGADEALAYDSLPQADRESLWSKLQARLMRWQSVCFVITMLVGAFLYRAESVNKLFAWFGMTARVDDATAMKFPVILCFIMALGCLGVALKFSPTPEEDAAAQTKVARLDWAAMRATVRGIGQTARWLGHSPLPLALIAVGLLGDSFMRLFYTVSSQFYRTISVPTEWNGPIGAAAALSGLAFAPVIAKLSKKLSGRGIYGLIGVLVLAGFLGIAHAVPIWGLWAAVPFWFGMRALHFNLSMHLNAAVPAEQRATTLSFRGLSMNLAYGVLMQSFGWQTLAVAKKLGTPPEACDTVFSQSMLAWPWIFLGCAVCIGVLFGRQLPGRNTTPATPA